ncbi:MAG: hypothetical protein J7448_11880, partial [Thermomicrobium sp.]|nr:hypothetical protein [Thermomicrobium sp.]
SPSDVPGVTLEVTLTYQNGQTAQYTLTCQAGANASPCGQIVLDDTIASADFQEPGLVEGWAFVPPSWSQLSSCNSNDCTVTVTNRDMRRQIRVQKQWRRGGSYVPAAEVPEQQLTLTVTLQGGGQVTQTVTCPAGQNPSNCGTIAVTGQVQSVAVSEPNLPEGWRLDSVYGTEWCAYYDCTVWVTNRDSRYPVHVRKEWRGDNGSLLDPAQTPGATIEVTIDGRTYTFT